MWNETTKLAEMRKQFSIRQQLEHNSTRQQPTTADNNLRSERCQREPGTKMERKSQEKGTS